jgi:DNA polymerase III subunit gamma/tau
MAAYNHYTGCGIVKAVMIHTYLPLYRKYRPQCFAELVGQDVIRTALSNAIAMDKVAHAYLFCGPRGTGKTSTARIFAKSLNCAQGPTANPCGQCPSCVGITQGQALDVIEFDAASHNGVSDAKELIETCQFAPMAGRYKIYIIDEVHMLSNQAFNTLLKTLEEPPPSVIFLFATTEAHKVLPTIISRCQRFDFARIAQPALETHLAHVAQTEGFTIDPNALAQIARMAKGGLRDALSLLDQVGVLYQGQTITAEAVRQAVGGVGPDTLYQLTDAVANQQVANLLSLLTQLEKDGVDPNRVVALLTEHIRDLMIFAQAPSAIDADVAQADRYAEQTQWFAPEVYPQWLFRLSQLDQQLKRTNQPQLWLEVALVEMAHRLTIASLSELTARLTALEAGQTTGALPAPAVMTPPVAKPLNPPATVSSPFAPVQPTPPVASSSPATQGPQVNAQADLRLTWQTIIERVASPGTKSLLKQQTFLKKLEGAALVVACSSEAIFKTLSTADKQIHMRKAVEAYLGVTTGVHIDMVIEKPTAGSGGVAPSPFASAPSALPPLPPAEPKPPVLALVVDDNPAMLGAAPVPGPAVVATPFAPVKSSPFAPTVAQSTPLAPSDYDLPPMDAMPAGGWPAPMDEEVATPAVMPLAETWTPAADVDPNELQAAKDNAVRLLQAKPLDAE